jgi:hypothetical protein
VVRALLIQTAEIQTLKNFYSIQFYIRRYIRQTRGLLRGPRFHRKKFQKSVVLPGPVFARGIEPGSNRSKETALKIRQNVVVVLIVAGSSRSRNS